MATPIKLASGRWRIRWVDEHGRRKSAVFTSREDALYALREAQRTAQLVRRGLKPAIIADKTFSDLCRYWLEHRAPQKRSGHYDESTIRAHLEPAFGAKRLAALAPEDFDVYVSKRAHLHAKTLSNHLTLLGTMLRAAIDLGWIISFPKIRKPKAKTAADTYSYLKDDGEIRRFLAAALDENVDAHDLYATAIFTGMRQGEIAGLKWSDVDFERKLITIRRSWNGPTKNGEHRHVPIMDDLSLLLKARRLRVSGEHVFQNEAGRMYLPKSRVFAETFCRVLRAAGFAEVQRSNRRRQYIVFHDLRHTFASAWMMSGGDIFKLQRVLGHKDMSMTQRYAHLAPQAFAGDHARLKMPRVGSATVTKIGVDALISDVPDAAGAGDHFVEPRAGPARSQ